MVDIRGDTGLVQYGMLAFVICFHHGNITQEKQGVSSVRWFHMLAQLHKCYIIMEHKGARTGT